MIGGNDVLVLYLTKLFKDALADTTYPSNHSTANLFLSDVIELFMYVSGGNLSVNHGSAVKLFCDSTYSELIPHHVALNIEICA
jgi:hypothetical protein